MNKILRLALCGVDIGSTIKEGAMPAENVETGKAPVVQEDEDKEQTILMTGPLAEVYTKALQIVFAKKDPVTQETSLESQMMMAAAVSDATTAMKEETDKKRDIINRRRKIPTIRKGERTTNVFVSEPRMVSSEVVIMAHKQLTRDDRSILVVDYGPNAYLQENKNFLLSKLKLDSLKEQCDHFKVKLVFGMEELVAELKRN